MVKVIDVGVTIDGVAFGGPQRNVLFVTATADRIKTATAKTVPTSEGGSSLYTITCLGAIGQKSSCFKIAEADLIPPNVCSI